MMIEILAAVVTGTEAQAPTVLQTYGPAGAILLALGGWKGIAQGILWLQGRGGNSNGKAGRVSEKECDRRHEAERQLRAAENAHLADSITKLDASVTKLHDRIDQWLTGKK